MSTLNSGPIADVMAAAARLVVPEIALVATACVLFTVASVAPKRATAFLVMVLGVTAAAVLAVWYGPSEAAVIGTAKSGLFHSTIDPHGPAGFIRWLAIATAGVFTFAVYSETTDRTAGEYYGCLAVIAAGVSLVGRANDLITLYLALEMISIPTYVLLYLPSVSKSGLEASVKYFLLSILSSAVLLFGFSYLYGAAGTTNLTALTEILAKARVDAMPPLASVGAVLAIAGIGFRIAAVPFHFYAPDVYEAGPTGVVSVLAVVPKIAGFAAFVRLFGLAGSTYEGQPFDDSTLVPFALWVLAAVSMTFGNVLALLQDNLKRMMAYSGIAHAGYLLIGAAVAGAGRSGLDAVYFYLAAYSLMAAGFFAVLTAVHRAERPVETVDDLAGLSSARPLLAICLAVSLLSMIGIPLTAGFPGKFQLFLAAYFAPGDTPMGSAYRTLAFVAAANAAIGAVYYLRVLSAVYLRTPLTSFASTGGKLATLAAIACAVGTIAIGVYPKPVVNAASKAAPQKNVSPLK